MLPASQLRVSKQKKNPTRYGDMIVGRDDNINKHRATLAWL